MTDRLLAAYGLIAVMVLIGAGLLLMFSIRRRKARRAGGRIDIGVVE